MVPCGSFSCWKTKDGGTRGMVYGLYTVCCMCIFTLTFHLSWSDMKMMGWADSFYWCVGSVCVVVCHFCLLLLLFLVWFIIVEVPVKHPNKIAKKRVNQTSKTVNCHASVFSFVISCVRVLILFTFLCFTSFVIDSNSVFSCL